MDSYQQQVCAATIVADLGCRCAWGALDCNTVAARAIDAATGTRLSALVAGKYATPVGALRHQLRLGRRFSTALADLGWRRAGFPLATGDVLVETRAVYDRICVVVDGKVALAVPGEPLRLAKIKAVTFDFVMRSPCPRP
jgi:hypothetical protein